MVCKTCGCKLNENDKFCRYCGTTVPDAPRAPVYQAPAQQPPVFNPTYTPVNNGAENPLNRGAFTQGGQTAQVPNSQQPYGPGSQNTYTPDGRNGFYPDQNTPAAKRPAKGAYAKPSAPRKPGKKPGKGLLIGGGVAAAVLLIALVVVLIITGNPTVKVGNAFMNTVKEFSKVGDIWNVEETAAFATKEAVSVSADMKIKSVSDDMSYYADAISGLGVQVDMDMDIANREMGMLASAYLGSTDLVTAMISAEDEMIYLGVPDFLNDFYGVNTETLMRDLNDMGADVGEAADIRINIFELIEIVRDYSGDAEENRKALTDATVALGKELIIEKDGKQTVKVNGESLKCQSFLVTVPQDALEDWFETVEDIAGSVDALEMMEELFNAVNLPEDIVEELMYDMENSYSEPDYSDVYELFDYLGDIELQVYVKSSKVAAVVYKEKFDGTKIEVGLYLGGGDRYVDNISLEIKIDGEKMTIKSEGDHTAREGVFTDELTITIPSYREDLELVMETEYDPKAESDNLAIRFGNEFTLFDMEGTYAVTKDRYELSFDKFRIVSDGVSLMDLAFSYEITDYEKRVKVSNARMLTDLTEEDFMSLAEELEGNAMEWALSLVTSHPELLEFLGL